jgi:excisionase family DNA binding protein
MGLPSPLSLRPRQAAKALGVSPRKLWEWTRAGIIPCVRIGTGKRQTILYPVAELQGWLAQRVEAAKGGAS